MHTYASKNKKSDVKRPIAAQEFYNAKPINSGSINLDEGRSLELPEMLRSRVQEQFGFSPDSIRVRESAQVADMGAKAAAQGNVISFAPGVYDPYSKAGQSLIGHELHHIAEQASGLGAGASSGSIHYDRSSEAASDISGGLFASGAGMASATAVTPISASAAPVQGFFKKLMNLFKRKPKEKTENYIRDEENMKRNDEWDALNSGYLSAPSALNNDLYHDDETQAMEDKYINDEITKEEYDEYIRQKNNNKIDIDKMREDINNYSGINETNKNEEKLDITPEEGAHIMREKSKADFLSKKGKTELDYSFLRKEIEHDEYKRRKIEENKINKMETEHDLDFDFDYDPDTEPVDNSRGGGGLMSKLWSGIKGIGSGIANKFRRRKTEWKFGETILED
jgi:hypothetical protein